ncbi:MAG: histidine phosphatase family protein [Elusimicrobia bacterium]|nr:histidine phosphatase family protein [Elusimicrobiota bacterium]
MRVVIIRHAIAEDRERFARTGRPDSERPLTKKGRRKFRAAVPGLKAVVPTVDVLAASPYTRAQETLALARRAYRKTRVETLADLAHGGSIIGIRSWLAKKKSGATIAVVGHEPDLSRLIAALTGGRSGALTLKKGGAAVIDFDGPPTRAGRLSALLPPSVLRDLADSV